MPRPARPRWWSPRESGPAVLEARAHAREELRVDRLAAGRTCPTIPHIRPRNGRTGRISRAAVSAAHFSSMILRVARSCGPFDPLLAYGDRKGARSRRWRTGRSPLADRARGAQAPVPGRQPADPLPQPRGAARRGRARGRDPGRAAHAGAIEHAVGDGRDWGWTSHHLEWAAEPDASAARSSAGFDFVDDEPVLVQQGDALLRERHARAHRRLRARAPRHAGVPARRRRDARARAATARPGYLLSPRAVSILLANASSGRNPVAGVRDRGGRVRVQRVDGSLPCHGDQEALLESNRQLLERIEPQLRAAVARGLPASRAR